MIRVYTPPRKPHTARIPFERMYRNMLEQIEKLWDTVVVTIFNTVTSTYALLNLILVVMAACFGSMLFGKVKAPLKDALLRGLGVFTFLMGASQMWDGFFVLQTGQVTSV